MKTTTLSKKLLALVISVLLIAAVFPLAASADGEFVSVNVLTGENNLVDLTNSTPVYHDKYLTENTFASGYGLSSSTITGLVDDDLTNECLFNGRGASSRLWNGVRYALTESCFAEKITIYSGLPALVDCYDVYASDSLSTLYNADHWLGEFTCTGTAVDVPVNREVQYLALIYNQGASANDSARPREIQLWTGDETAAFAPVCLTEPSLNKLADYSCVAVTPATMATSTRTLGNKSGVPMLEYFATNETNSHADVSQSGSTYTGFQYGFDNMYYIGDIVIDAGTWNCDETWDVYASNSLATLYTEDAKVASVTADKARGVRVAVNQYATYVALVQTTGYARIRALRIYTADATGVPMPFISENVLRTDLNEVVPVVQYVSSGNVAYENVITAEKLAFFTDGDTVTHKDLSDTLGWDPARKIGAQFTLNDPAYIGSILLYASLTNYPESYSVYASDSLETLYAAESKVANAEATNGTTLNIEVNKTVQYIAFFCESSSGGPRFKEIEAWTAEAPEVFTPVNVLATSLDSATAKAQYAASFNDEALISAANLALFTDGDTTTHVDLQGTIDWDPSRKIGAEFALTEAAYIGEIKLYASIGESFPESYSVYASNSLETLYTAENKLADAVSTTGSAIVVPTNKTVQYIAFFCDSYTGNPRFKEIEAWTAEEPVVFVSENALDTSLDSAAAIVQFTSNGNISESAVISAENLAAFTDGNTTTHVDLNDTLGWDPARKIGAKFTLTDAMYIGTIKLYASIGASYPETYTVYASETEEMLYAPANKLISEEETTGSVIEIPVNAEVQYIAFICDSYTGNPRFKEIEAWTADPNAVEPEEPTVPGPINDGVTRVLTIGNSFAENASIYASEIAYANGEQMMFGYLKYPSCTLQRHLYDAENDVAEFKFRVTSPTGTGTTVADGSSTFYSIKQALFYTHWDVIVFQQESSSARYYDTYSYLADLIEYVKDYYPEARLMFHQVWRWGEWESDQWDLIKSASEKAAYENGLEIIPSGLAFENARTAMDSVNFLNEDDGHYQHANRYGQYIEGCCYTAAIFGIEISSTTFASHPYVNDTGDVATFTAAANAAIAYYNSNGDIDGVAGLGAGDLALMMQVLLESNEDEVDMTLADANKDSVVNILDLIWLKKELAKVAD